MQIYLCCPECGNTNWLYRVDAGAFECLACGVICFAEDMGAVDSDGDEIY